MKTIAMYSIQPVLAEGLRNLLEDVDGVCFSEFYPDADLMQARFQESGAPDVLVIDMTASLSLPALSRLSEAAPRTAIVLWLETAAVEFATQALQMGVRGVLLKNARLEMHAECLRDVAAGRLWVQSEIGNKLLSAKQTNLTRRERQLMVLLAQGLKNKQIAWQLQITEGTVKVYLSHLFRKVGVGDRFELALLALRNMVPDQGGALEAPAPAEGCFTAFTMPRMIASTSPRPVAYGS